VYRLPALRRCATATAPYIWSVPPTLVIWIAYQIPPYTIMKKTLIFLFCLLSMTAVRSQTSIGIKAGANFPNPTGSDVSSSVNGKTGFYAGGLLVVPVSTNFRFQPEILWSSQGYKYNELGGEFETNFSYVHLLALVQYVKNGFFVETGPQLGILVTAKRKGGTLGTEDIKDSFKSIAFSWNAGVGYRMQSGLGIDLRYTIGIGSISSDENTDVKFNTLMLGISKTFNLTKKKK
jgi:hypothetical protein